MRALSREEARRIAVRSSGLAGGVDSILGAVHTLGDVQIDPTNVVARTHRLVLWSRLGQYEVEELDRLLWDERSLFEWNAFLYPARDAPIHRVAMSLYPIGDRVRSRYIRDWLTANAAFERYILRELETRGPLRSRDLEDRAAVPWQSGGWNDGKNLSRMLEILAQQGKVMVAGRDKAERIWDLGSRVLAPTETLGTQEAARRHVLGSLRARGLARPAAIVNRASWLGWVAPGVLDELEEEGHVERVNVEGVEGEWAAAPEALADADFEPRTTLLSPFDNLIRDRERTEDLFGFHYRLEIYVPKAKREYGYWVMPVLAADELVGRIDVEYDRDAEALRVNAAFPEDGRRLHLDKPLASLAAFVGATRVA
ncbi:MAG TPA: crosslink repair DNA glycosylase YcaQ family protein [Gaiellaceae bacterium]|nr:crosslink repair DNA glycosylase YcaQ family protein [Gaiellaceae bacterium]